MESRLEPGFGGKSRQAITARSRDRGRSDHLLPGFGQQHLELGGRSRSVGRKQYGYLGSGLDRARRRKALHRHIHHVREGRDWRGIDSAAPGRHLPPAPAAGSSGHSRLDDQAGASTCRRRSCRRQSRERIDDGDTKCLKMPEVARQHCQSMMLRCSGEIPGLVCASRPIRDRACNPRCRHIESKNAIAIKVQDRLQPG